MTRIGNDLGQSAVQTSQELTTQQAPVATNTKLSVSSLLGLNADTMAKIPPGLLAELQNAVGILQDLILASGLDMNQWLQATSPQKLSQGELVASNVQGAINQGAPECRNATLGYGPCTIGQAGCFLGTLTEAHNEFARRSGQGSTVDIVTANDKVKTGGGFTGSNLIVNNAARSLDMSLRWRGLADHKTLADAKAELDAGNLVYAGVDYKPGSSSGVSKADHFLLLTSAGDGTFRAKDPAGGRELVFHRDPASGDYICGKYRICELGALEQTNPPTRVPTQFMRC